MSSAALAAIASLAELVADLLRGHSEGTISEADILARCAAFQAAASAADAAADAAATEAIKEKFHGGGK